MVKKTQSEPKPPLELKQPHDVARSQISERVTKGRELQSVPASGSEETIGTFEAQFRKWNDYNETLLDTLFTNDDEKIKYRWSLPGAVMAVREQSAYARHHRLVDQIGTLSNALESLAERIGLIPLAEGIMEDSRSSERTSGAVWDLLHARIRQVAKGRFDNGHYADAVEAALKELNNEVKRIAKARGAAGDLDGANLMHTVFSPKAPIVVLGDLSTQSGKDMQQGYMELFAGSMSAVRNPKAHENVTISAERAIHFLFLASMLWETLELRP